MAAAGALALLVLSIVMSRFVIFLVGAAVGAVIGARLFALLGGDDPSWLLAVLFVPTFGFVSGFLAQRMGSKFLRWATAIAGAALILSAVGSMFSDDLGLLQTPDDPGQSTRTPSCGSRSRSSATRSSAPRRAGATPRRPMPRRLTRRGE